MKLLPMFLAASALLACQSEPKHQAAAHVPVVDAAATTFDLSACAERAMTAEEFVKRCQEATGMNFTYEQATAETMRAVGVRFDGPSRLPAAELERYLSTQLARCGLTCRPVGPASLRVFVVERSKP